MVTRQTHSTRKGPSHRDSPRPIHSLIASSACLVPFAPLPRRFCLRPRKWLGLPSRLPFRHHPSPSRLFLHLNPAITNIRTKYTVTPNRPECTRTRRTTPKRSQNRQRKGRRPKGRTRQTQYTPSPSSHPRFLTHSPLQPNTTLSNTSSSNAAVGFLTVHGPSPPPSNQVPTSEVINLPKSWVCSRIGRCVLSLNEGVRVADARLGLIGVRSGNVDVEDG